MKIKKSRLRQLIKEEISAYRGRLEEEAKAAAPDPAMGQRRPRNTRDLAKMIAVPAKAFKAYVRPDELKEHTLSVYADLMNKVITAWGKQASGVHGCETNSETKECQIISSIMKNFHNKIGPLVAAIEEGLEGRAAAKFIVDNSNMLLASMDWVPGNAGKRFSDFSKTKVWQQAERSGNFYVGREDDDL